MPLPPAAGSFFSTSSLSKRSKIWPRFSSGMPIPLSLISNTAFPPSERRTMRTVPDSGVYLQALLIRFTRIFSSLRLSVKPLTPPAMSVSSCSDFSIAAKRKLFAIPRTSELMSVSVTRSDSSLWREAGLSMISSLMSLSLSAFRSIVSMYRLSLSLSPGLLRSWLSGPTIRERGVRSSCVILVMKSRCSCLKASSLRRMRNLRYMLTSRSAAPARSTAYMIFAPVPAHGDGRTMTGRSSSLLLHFPFMYLTRTRKLYFPGGRLE